MKKNKIIIIGYFYYLLLLFIILLFIYYLLPELTIGHKLIFCPAHKQIHTSNTYNCSCKTFIGFKNNNTLLYLRVFLRFPSCHTVDAFRNLQLNLYHLSLVKNFCIEIKIIDCTGMETQQLSFRMLFSRFVFSTLNRITVSASYVSALSIFLHTKIDD